MTDSTGTESYFYDVYGRVTQLQKIIGGKTYTIGYSYNFANQLTQVTYPSGRQVAQQIDAIGRLNQIQSGGVNFLTINPKDYNAAFQPTKLTLGNGVQETIGYNSRLQLASLAYSSGSTSLLNLTYNYTSTATPGNNGQIQSITDAVDPGRSESLTYDAWNRLKTAQTTGSTNFPAWGLNWDYDRYGNRKAQNVTAGSAFSNQLIIDQTTNRLVGAPYAYDLSGNMTNDGVNAIVYDGENRVASSTQSGLTTNYAYDGNGLRIQKQTGGSATVYLFSGSKLVAEYASGASATSPLKEYIYSGSQLLATLSGSTTNYHIGDHISPRGTTDSAGTALGQQAQYPFGDDWYANNTTTKFKFTSYERDTESGNDYALARYDISRLGRFSSPDPLAGSLINPQSLNRYAYVLNNPLNLVDPTGLYSCHYTRVGTQLCGPSVAGDGGGGSCTLDGVEVPCDMAVQLAQIGATQGGDPGSIPGVIQIFLPGGSVTSGGGTTYFSEEWVTIFLPQGTGSSGNSGGAANNGPTISAAPRLPWYKNPCITGALSAGALSVGIDSIGLIPEAGGVARVIGHQAGYVGVVADQVGARVIKGVGGTASTGLTVAGFIPGFGQGAAIGSIILDTYKTVRTIGKCH